jgi:hypothetical protein
MGTVGVVTSLSTEKQTLTVPPTRTS